jgi:ribosomal protein L7/L12
MLLESAKVLVENMPENVKERVSREKDMADYEVEEPGEAA